MVILGYIPAGIPNECLILDPVVDDNLKVSFDILSINTRGIRDSLKRHKVFEWLKNHTSKNAVISVRKAIPQLTLKTFGLSNGIPEES